MKRDLRDSCRLLLVLFYLFLPGLVLLGAIAFAPSQDYSTTDVATITEMELMENVRVLAHKTMGGRGTLNGGCELPAFFLERELREYGFEPFGDAKDDWRTYFQKFSARTVDLEGNGISVMSQNVIGYLEGENKDELVIFGAHYDHIGPGEMGRRAGKPDEILCGADDNASGIAAALEVAEAFGEMKKKNIKPKRGIIVAFWGAEELGLLGSEHFLNHPPEKVDVKNIIAYVNMDMVGRNNLNELFIYCGPADEQRQCAELYKIAESVNRRLELGFKISHEDDRFGFSRTDGWSFYALRDSGSGGAIPVWELFTGEHPDYHTPRDTWEKLDYSKLARVAKLAFGIVWRVSQMDGKPKYEQN